MLPNPQDPSGPPLTIPLELAFDNQLNATSQGAELLFDWQVSAALRFQSTYTFIELTTEKDSGSTGERNDRLTEGSSPDHLLSLRLLYDLSENLSLDLWAYYVDNLRATTFVGTNKDEIDDYTRLNLQLKWQPLSNIEVSLVGQNLTDSRHPEFVSELYVPAELERSVFAGFRLTF